MAIQTLLICSFETGVSVLTARAYGASWKQAAIFTIANGLVTAILRRLVISYIQNTHQFALATITIQATSGLAGVLATRLFCERAIDWKQALATSLFSDRAVNYVCAILEPADLEFKND